MTAFSATLVGLAGILALAAGGKPAASKSPPRLACRISAERSHKQGEPVTVRFALQNRSSEALSVLIWHTPIEGILNDIFDIKGPDGESLPYIGPMVKRAAPDADAYVTIAPGEEATGEVDLTAAYELLPGRYTVAFKGPIQDVAPAARPRKQGEELRPARLEPCTLTLEIVARR